LALATVCVAGCAKSEDRMGPQLRQGARPGQEIPENIPDEDAPRVLPETHLAAARLFESRGQFPQAIAQYRKAIAVNHNYGEAYHRLGLLLSAMNQREEAIEALTRAVDLSPHDATARNNLGFELMLAGRWSAAEQQLTTAVALKPDFPRATVNLGIVHANLGRFDQALAEFQKALPEADAYYNLGLMYRGQRRYADAIGAFERALSLNPNLTAASTQLQRLAGHRGEAEMAPVSQPGAARLAEKANDRPIIDRTSIVKHSADIRTESPGTSAMSDGTELRHEPVVIADSAPAAASEAAANHSASTPQVSRHTWHTLADLVALAEAEFDCRRELNGPTSPEEIVDDAQFGISLADGRAIPFAPSDSSFSPVRAGRDAAVMFASVIEAEPSDGASLAEWTVDQVSTVDSWGLLRELESELAVVREEVECLQRTGALPFRWGERLSQMRFDSAPPPAIGPMVPLMGPPAPEEFDPDWSGPAPSTAYTPSDSSVRRSPPVRD
jgi:tetratricopeptide (TPR) repeat protein